MIILLEQFPTMKFVLRSDSKEFDLSSRVSVFSLYRSIRLMSCSLQFVAIVDEKLLLDPEFQRVKEGTFITDITSSSDTYKVVDTISIDFVVTKFSPSLTITTSGDLTATDQKEQVVPSVSQVTITCMPKHSINLKKHMSMFEEGVSSESLIRSLLSPIPIKKISRPSVSTLTNVFLPYRPVAYNLSYVVLKCYNEPTIVHIGTDGAYIATVRDLKNETRLLLCYPALTSAQASEVAGYVESMTNSVNTQILSFTTPKEKNALGLDEHSLYTQKSVQFTQSVLDFPQREISVHWSTNVGESLQKWKEISKITLGLTLSKSKKILDWRPGVCIELQVNEKKWEHLSGIYMVGESIVHVYFFQRDKVRVQLLLFDVRSM